MNLWKIILAAIVIFSAGVFTGGLLTNCVNHPHRPKMDRSSKPPVADTRPQNNQNNTNRPPRSRPPEMFGRDSKEFMQKMDEKLQLTPEQHDTIEKIVAEGQKRNSEVWSNALPLMRQIMNETRQHIRDQLTSDQQKQFEELMKRPPRRQNTNSPSTITPTNFPAATTSSAR